MNGIAQMICMSNVPVHSARHAPGREWHGLHPQDAYLAALNAR
jgi:hypothetical protein